ncbi:lysylphosphatidylglycerol synthase transmembrane domain-containing protein [Carboxylicivirga caseinilyticus]|uniref:lysylphosphatidylglycerol synthase transmembrane domain-containing protein n=1 Tax=Carboxylicivirga caseinilyticus TaxID=3417572 RepID=UPI003D343A8A|nr:flippase-like domain-containing protein [Marinilabiliaceae bacterium A049]
MALSKKTINVIKLILKLVFSSAAIYYIVSKLNLREVGDLIKTARLWYVFMAMLLYGVSQLLSSFRLNGLFKAIQLNIPHLSNIKLYWLGMFYNFFLPGGVGGDGYKVFYLHKRFKTPVKQLLGAVLADRVSGLSIILVYILGLVYFIEYDLPYKGWFFLLIPFVSFGFYLFLRIFNKKLTKAFGSVTFWSLIVQGIQMIAVLCLLKALGGQTKGHWDDYMFLFFLSTIASAIPITLGGIGAREVTFFKGAILLGINQEIAVAVSVLFYLNSLMISIPGIYYVFRVKRIFSEVEEADVAVEI